MNASIKGQIRLTGLSASRPAEEPTEYIAYAQNSFLSELPGLAFGLLTVAYIVSSLLSLA
ncbi:MAG TPA: hypothetical protein VEC38_08520 [Candidatus Binataceae bacterium]|nr:hypothetical protein [Candidatus Binataceae bacterium]